MTKNITLPILYLLLGCVLIIKGKQHEIEITSYNPDDKSTHTFYKFINLSNETNVIAVRSNSENYTGFYILQAHSHRFNLSLTPKNEMNRTENGRNIGLTQKFNRSFEHFFSIEAIMNNDSDRIDSPVLIAVVVYDLKAPIPGGGDKINDACPIVTISNSPEIITLHAVPPSTRNVSHNGSQDVLIEIYHKYLPSHNFNTSEYFQNIISMLSVDQIKSNGIRAVVLNDYNMIEAFFSTYVGTGEVFTILIQKDGVASSYVPTVSYGEDINYLIDKGNESNNTYALLFTILPFISLVIIYLGHTFFHLTTFLLGLSCGTIMFFFFLGTEDATTIDETFFISLLFGILYGSIWLGIWYKFGIPLLSATLAFLHVGALFTCIIYHFGVADDENFHNNAIYWTVFFGIVFMCWFSLSMFTMHGHILSCAFLGSYILMITTLNHWIGGNLQYIVINVYRRIFISNFNVAILQPPFQVQDHFIALIGILFLLHGFVKQVKRQNGKPPFPPHQTFRGTGERSPLLGHF